MIPLAAATRLRNLINGVSAEDKSEIIMTISVEVSNKEKVINHQSENEKRTVIDEVTVNWSRQTFIR